MRFFRVAPVSRRKTLAIIFSSIAAVSLCIESAGAEPTPSEKAYALFRKGKAESSAMEDDLAIQDYCLSLKYNPNSVVTHIERGDCYSHLNKPKEAEADYLKALDLCTTSANPSDRDLSADAMQRLEPYYVKNGELPKAMALWEKVVAKTHHPRDFLQKGRFEVTAKLYDKAEKDLIKALPEEKVFVDASLALGRLYMQEHKYPQALSTYSAAVEKIKKSRGGFHSQTRYKIFAERARCYMALKEPELAQKDQKEFEQYRDEWYDMVPFRSK